MIQESNPKTMIEEITYKDQVLSIIIPSEFREPGINFFTPDSFSQQLAYMKHPKGKSIQPHIHKQVRREVFYTQEVLLIKKGKLRVDFYNDEQEYLESRILKGGDVILLIKGGHGFEVLEELEMIEVKQGPYVGNNDKVRFSGIDGTQATVTPES
jgi:mannose-6-phosphate isomerase-like protein (cupin superfamily)